MMIQFFFSHLEFNVYLCIVPGNNKALIYFCFVYSSAADKLISLFYCTQAVLKVIFCLIISRVNDTYFQSVMKQMKDIFNDN